MNDLRSRVQAFEESSVDKIVVTRLENKIRDLEARLDLETTTKHRLEVCAQLKKTLEANLYGSFVAHYWTIHFHM